MGGLLPGLSSRRAGFTRRFDPHVVHMALARVEAISGRPVVAAHLDDIRIAEVEHLALRDTCRLERGIVAGRHLREAGDHIVD